MLYPLHLSRRCLLAASAILSSLCGGGLVAAPSVPFVPALTLQTVWQDNITNADASPDKVSGLELRTLGSAEQRYALGRDDTFFLKADFSGEVWAKYSGLNAISAGPHLALRHKFGLGAYAPAIRLEVMATDAVVRNSYRSGWTEQVSLSYNQRFSEAWRFELGSDYSNFDARDALFSKRAVTVGTAATYDLDERWRLKAGLRYRNGEFISYASTIDNPYIANRYVHTYGTSFYASKLRGHTWSYSIGIAPALAPYTALDFEFERSNTENALARYVNNIFSLSVVQQF